MNRENLEVKINITDYWTFKDGEAGVKKVVSEIEPDIFQKAFSEMGEIIAEKISNGYSTRKETIIIKVADIEHELMCKWNASIVKGFDSKKRSKAFFKDGIQRCSK